MQLNRLVEHDGDLVLGYSDLI